MNQPMDEPRAPLFSRLYGMAQHLLIAQVHDQPLATAAPRGVVEKQDAVDAVFQLAAALDELVQGGAPPVERGMWMMSLLMVIRDYIEPLPPGLDNDGVTDLVTPDLAEMVSAIRATRTPTPGQEN
jgi:hypothetical protein